MTDEMLQDLKQFIASTVSQQLSLQMEDLEQRIDLKFINLEKKIDNKIDSLDSKLSGMIQDLSESVADSLDASNEVTDLKLKNHEKRFSKLETKLA